MKTRRALHWLFSGWGIIFLLLVVFLLLCSHLKKMDARAQYLMVLQDEHSRLCSEAWKSINPIYDKDAKDLLDPEWNSRILSDLSEKALDIMSGAYLKQVEEWSKQCAHD
ncbi:MAG TPA: hypothetical protein VMG30_13825 [Acidobacteriota bacterium]|nr:hypothetical protein [Acidobacteriota bacterium]